ncbi:hypothetical protein V8G54_007957 [Vigna mungo]|uniref:NADH-quinone oxidoreductase subunit D domain-containing protein n=1 Tax=Vigna mungo TaxID=3915 RepID=A0AAQ3P4A5_VIGMU
MIESITIIQQALEGLSGRPYENLEICCFDREKEPEWNEFEYQFISKKSSSSFELPKQELYVRIETPKGELGIFLIGDQNGFPWRWKIHLPDFINLQILPQLKIRVKSVFSSSFKLYFTFILFLEQKSENREPAKKNPNPSVKFGTSLANSDKIL